MIDVVGLTRHFTYTGKATTFNWTRYGIKIHFPDYDDKTQIVVTIANVRLHPSTFKLPENTELVSGIYSITSSHPFRKPVTLELEHDLSAEDEASELIFVTARSVSSTSPEEAKFEILPGGTFPSGCRYGSISLTHFSLFGIVANPTPSILQQVPSIQQRDTPPWLTIFYTIGRLLTSLVSHLFASTQPQAPVHRYSCRHFQIRQSHQRNCFEVHMVITHDLQVCKRVS